MGERSRARPAIFAFRRRPCGGAARIGPPEWEEIPKTLACSGDVRPLQSPLPPPRLLPSPVISSTNGFPTWPMHP